MKQFILKKIFLSLFAVIIVGQNFAHAQHDTTKYLSYKKRFIVAVYQSVRQFDYKFSQTLMPDSLTKSSVNYLADAKTVTGLEFDFDKLSLSFGIKSTPPVDEAKKGKTTYTNLNVNFGGNKFTIENSFRKFKGFYDINTNKYDTSYKSTGIYYQNPSMNIKQFKTKFFYFFNHKKFSYKSSYTCIYRQLKSSYSLVGSANFYYNSMQTDSSFIPRPVRNFYQQYEYNNGIRTIGASAGGGISVNLVVFKRVFLNLTGVVNLEPQWRKYSYLFKENSTVCYISGSFDGRAAIGYNGDKFFISVTSMNDFISLNTRKTKTISKFVSGAFTLGYRFKVKKTPKFYQKIQETKIYKMV